MSLGWGGVASAAACDAVALTAAAADAKLAFVSMDGAAFAAAAAAARAAVPCQPAALPPDVAAQVHLVGALESFLARDELHTIAAFQAARAADPALTLDAWLPEQHPLHLEWRMAARLEQDPPLTLDDAVFVDGARTDALVPSRPAVLQAPAGGSAVSRSIVWHPGEALPEWAPLAPVRLTPAARRHIGFGGATAAAAVAGGTLWYLSNRAATEFVEPDLPYSQVDKLRDESNTKGVAAIAAGGVAAGLGAALVLSW